jgi:hypothetical protein
MKKDKRIPSEIDESSWDKMTDFTIGFGYMILYLSILGIVLLMIKDIMI